jgi:hypothetical protein
LEIPDEQLKRFKEREKNTCSQTSRLEIPEGFSNTIIGDKQLFLTWLLHTRLPSVLRLAGIF